MKKSVVAASIAVILALFVGVMSFLPKKCKFSMQMYSVNGETRSVDFEFTVYKRWFRAHHVSGTVVIDGVAYRTTTEVLEHIPLFQTEGGMAQAIYEDHYRMDFLGKKFQQVVLSTTGTTYYGPANSVEEAKRIETDWYDKLGIAN